MRKCSAASEGGVSECDAMGWLKAFCIIVYGSTVRDVAAGFRRKGWGVPHAMTFGLPIGLAAPNAGEA